MDKITNYKLVSSSSKRRIPAVHKMLELKRFQKVSRILNDDDGAIHLAFDHGILGDFYRQFFSKVSSVRARCLTASSFVFDESISSGKLGNILIGGLEGPIKFWVVVNDTNLINKL